MPMYNTSQTPHPRTKSFSRRLILLTHAKSNNQFVQSYAISTSMALDTVHVSLSKFSTAIGESHSSWHSPDPICSLLIQRCVVARCICVIVLHYIALTIILTLHYDCFLHGRLISILVHQHHYHVLSPRPNARATL
jgi:hypothetical protein